MIKGMTVEEQALIDRTRIESKPEHQAFKSGGCPYCGAAPQKPCDNEKHKQIAAADRERAERIRLMRLTESTAGIPQAEDLRTPLGPMDIAARGLK
jgi:hypothetical protein